MGVMIDRDTNARAVWLADASGNVAGTASSPTYTTAANYTPKGYQQIANTTLAASTALTVPTGAKIAIVQNNGSQPVRFRDDGLAPTATTGQRIAAGDPYTYDGDLSVIRFIREADGVTLDIAYYA